MLYLDFEDDLIRLSEIIKAKNEAESGQQQAAQENTPNMKNPMKGYKMPKAPKMPSMGSFKMPR